MHALSNVTQTYYANMFSHYNVCLLITVDVHVDIGFEANVSSYTIILFMLPFSTELSKGVSHFYWF